MFHYTCCNTPKSVTSLQHCFRFYRPEIWTSDLPLQRRTRYRWNQGRLACMCCSAAAPAFKSTNFFLSNFNSKKEKHVKILIHFARSLKKKHKKSNTEYAIHFNNMATLLVVLQFLQLSLWIKNKHKMTFEIGKFRVGIQQGILCCFFGSTNKPNLKT